MIDINPKDDITGAILAEEDHEVKRKYEDDTSEEPESQFYVERESRLIYEVKFFPEFALIRPAHPDCTAAVERLSLVAFANNFEEYGGNPQDIRDYLWGAEIGDVNVEKR